ncbi:thermonuclease family protein [Vampirovibrio sp.]|uniref:thermonuclease family protein n=1 Tax=Vampirovibrio sp. TaxID=2717857 RepID=UPI0035946558
MKRLGLKFNEKAVGLILIILGLAWLWRGWLASPRSGAIQDVGAETGQKAISQKTILMETGRTSCKVLTVFDGDTLGCDLNQDGRIQKPQEQVRLLGIDSPEMRYSRKNPTYGSQHPTDEPFAKEASQWLTEAAQGKTVYLEWDQRRLDKYQRTLAYVFAESTAPQSLNAQLLAKGYATVLFLGKNRRYEPEFKAAEQQARSKQQGLWATDF